MTPHCEQPLEHSYAPRFAQFVAENQAWVSRLGHVAVYASAAYPMAQVCLGRLAGAIFPDAGRMHIAAGAAIAKEIGLEVTGRDGSPIDWRAEGEVPLLIVAWPEVHRQLLEVING